MKFNTATILTITTGRFVCGNFDLVYEILNFMTGDDFVWYQLPRAGEECESYLRDQFPWVVEYDDITEDNWQGRVRHAEATYGPEHDVRPIPMDDHDVIDPMEELRAMRPDMEFIQINIEEKPNDIGNINWKVE